MIQIFVKGKLVFNEYNCTYFNIENDKTDYLPKKMPIKKKQYINPVNCNV